MLHCTQQPGSKEGGPWTCHCNDARDGRTMDTCQQQCSRLAVAAEESSCAGVVLKFPVGAALMRFTGKFIEAQEEGKARNAPPDVGGAPSVQGRNARAAAGLTRGGSVRLGRGIGCLTCTSPGDTFHQTGLRRHVEPLRFCTHLSACAALLACPP